MVVDSVLAGDLLWWFFRSRRRVQLVVFSMVSLVLLHVEKKREIEIKAAAVVRVRSVRLFSFNREYYNNNIYTYTHDARW